MGAKGVDPGSGSALAWQAEVHRGARASLTRARRPTPPTLSRTGSGGSGTFNFTSEAAGDKLRVTVTVLAYGDVFDPQGKLFAQDQKFLERTAAIFVVEAY